MPDLREFEDTLRERSGDRCELCGSAAELAARLVPPGPASADRCVLVCATCRAQLDGEAELDANHWYCLQAAAWSEVPAVQVVSVRTLRRLDGQAWAQELFESLYLDEERQAWADAGDASGDEAGSTDGPPTLDSNGTALADGDSVTLIKDLDVKGGGFVAKRGTLVKGIRLTGDPEHVEGRVNKVTIVLKTRFLKKA